MFDRRPRRRAVAVGAAATASAVCLSLLGVAPAQAADVTHTIAQVQGTPAQQGAGGASPLAGQMVTVEGIVIGDHRTGGYRGFYLQTPGPETDDHAPRTASSSSSRATRRRRRRHRRQGEGHRPGERVQHRHADHRLGRRRRRARPGRRRRDHARRRCPRPCSAPRAKRSRACWCSPSGTYQLVSSHNLQNFGELWTSAGATMPVEAFETAAPNTKAASDITTANNNARLLLDDGYSIRIDNAAHLGDQPYFTKDVVVRNGDVVNFPAGGSILSYDFGNWRLQPPTPLTDASAANLKPTFTSTPGGNPRPATAPAGRRRHHCRVVQRAELLHDAHIAEPQRPRRRRPPRSSRSRSRRSSRRSTASTPTSSRWRRSRTR